MIPLRGRINCVRLGQKSGNRVESVLREMEEDMDTSLLATLFMIAPDLMEEVELRTLVLERVAALEPIGRRALAQRLHLAEREVRSAADALKNAGCIVQSAAGMELTEYGKGLVEAARMVSRGRRTLSQVELALSRKLNAERVCVVHGDADIDESVLGEAAQATAGEIRFLLQDAHVLAVSGGRTMAMTAEAVSVAAPMDVTVVAAQGGTGSSVALQADTLAELLGQKLGGQSRLLHLPEGVSPQMIEELVRLPQVRETMELVRHADVLLYGVSRAQELARRRGLNLSEMEQLEKGGAAAEVLGLYFDLHGNVVGGRGALGLRAQDMGRSVKTAAVACGHSKAEAIMAICLHHPHRLLVTDEGAALRMLELLRV